MIHYGCYNRLPFVDRTTQRDHHGRVTATWPAVMAKDFQFTKTDLGKTDARFDGCRWRAA